jgi:hypothetical protein
MIVIGPVESELGFPVVEAGDRIGLVSTKTFDA